MTIIEQLQDLHKQATTERSHYYVAKCCRDAIAEITRLEHDLASARFAASGFETEAKKERARLDHLIDQAYDHKKCDSPEEVYLSILRGTNTASVRTIIDAAMLTSTAQEGK